VVKDKVRVFFKSRFDVKDAFQIRLNNVSFNSISEEDNKILVDDFSEEEIWEAVWSYDCSKSPDLDDFNFGFIKFSWDFIKRDVVSTVKYFAVSGK